MSEERNREREKEGSFFSSLKHKIDSKLNIYIYIFYSVRQEEIIMATVYPASEKPKEISYNSLYQR